MKSVAILALSLLLSLPAGAADQKPVAAADARAKAAFAFARAKQNPAPEPKDRAAAVPVAPFPHAVAAKLAECICGEACKCAAGNCPAKCPVVGPVRFTASDGSTYEMNSDGVYRRVAPAPAVVVNPPAR